MRDERPFVESKKHTRPPASQQPQIIYTAHGVLVDGTHHFDGQVRISDPSSESPLPLNPLHPIKSSPLSYHGRQRCTSTVRATKEGAGLLVRL